MSTKTGTPRDEGPAADTGSDLGAAGSQLSTAPTEDVALPSLGPLGWARWFWRQLTSMRVALLLLFLLSVGAIPGSLIPQTSIDPVKVDQFKNEHTTLADIYDKLGMFHVYSSVWFSAIYLLLFISLIGCIVPRSWQFVGQLRGRPPAAPRRLTRLPAYTTWRTNAAPEEVLGAAHRLLKKRRFRAHLHGTAVAAEKGYLREVGNLVFHLALIVMLVAFAVGSLWKSEGGKLITEGDGFANSLTQYDDFTSGAFFDTDTLEPFGFTLNKFEATYERSGPEKGTPRIFRAHITYFSGADGKEHKTAIEVNTPLDIAGSKVYLLNHGYAPEVTVKDGRGKVVYKGAVPFLPQDPKNFTSTGVVKVPGAQTKGGKPNQLGFQGFFVPTFGGKGSGSMFSQFPALDYPVLTLTAYHGDLGVGSGLPQNVYQLDKKRLKQYKDKGRPVAKMMLPGETMKLPNGDGSIKFTGIKSWASFKISHQPGNGLALTGAAAALVGLAGSLFIQRRRVWIRAEADADGHTVVELAGLGRSESARLPEELAELALALEPDAPLAPATGDDGRAPDPKPGPAPDAGPGPDSEDPAEPTDSDGPADPSEGARA
ncbi:cytochrome c biogenesis protein ResB [Streptomyces sp. Je 1-4]|uniref:cytochrome c biogenesis protein ResB n=1 Tax=Streptomyces TaxID=1883 RepID=UPI0021D8D67C|nr:MULTISPECIES: cytochrome c biogenesis protein ResB [unclassified Streptomyces]UYB41618.1 cytochrome c biogenesis protein ResB [Streptomyces sp. Je 1-4]UZQ37867.1 cytochrome c biogenesis protein ResB [Streptomyces sp. Je 1-4] [Streptomyces sp. Je 1-4 4N24]UZQ45284.1 cytochrome c biogenesis protein ResB [Streptomyces sp. Je 1-4] [Streptomyces sp. Je 1-4 4N24_ara]